MLAGMDAGGFGVLGIVLVIVGFVLLHNGWFGFVKTELKSNAAAVVNFIGGGTIFIIALFTLLGGAYFSAAIYFLVGLTYLYIGFDHAFGLDARPFGVFCLTGAIGLFIGGISTVAGGIVSGFDVWMAIMWFSWAVLWFILFFECAFGKKFGKLTPVICVATTFYTGLIPGFMMLMGLWG